MGLKNLSVRSRLVAFYGERRTRELLKEQGANLKKMTTTQQETLFNKIRSIHPHSRKTLIELLKNVLKKDIRQIKRTEDLDNLFKSEYKRELKRRVSDANLRKENMKNVKSRLFNDILKSREAIIKFNRNTFIPWSDVLALAKKIITDESQPFEATFLSYINPDINLVYQFRSILHFEKWINQLVNPSIRGSDPTAQDFYDELGNADIFRLVNVSIKPLAGGCSQHKQVSKIIPGNYGVFNAFSPQSQRNNCGLEVLRELVDIRESNCIIRKQFGLTNKEKIDILKLNEIYKKFKTDTDKPLKIFTGTNDYRADDFTDDYHNILLRNEHYYLITHFEPRVRDTTKKICRGDMYFDLETRKCERFVRVKSNGKDIYVPVQKDAITAVYYKPFSAYNFVRRIFRSNKNKSSVEQYMEFMRNEAEAGRFYHSRAYNGANFDFYFLLSHLTPDETAKAQILLCGKSILSFSFHGHDFKDPCKIFMASLDSVCKDYKVDTAKLKEFTLNKRQMTNVELMNYKSELTFDEFMELQDTDKEYWSLYENYCLVDCIAMKEVFEKLDEQINKLNEKLVAPKFRGATRLHSKPTIGSLSMSLFVQYVKDRKRQIHYQHALKFVGDDAEKDKYLREYHVCGGISHCHQPGVHTEGTAGADICSMYPSAQIHMPIPCGESRWLEPQQDVKTLPQDIHGFITLHNLRFGKTKAFKPLAEKGKEKVLNWTTGDFIENANLDTYTIKYLQKHYGLISFDIVKGLVSNEYVLGKKIFGRFVKTLFAEKKEQDVLKDTKDPSYNPAYRSSIKLILNSTTGKLIENKERHKTLAFYDEPTKEDLGKYETLNGINCEKLDNPDVKFNRHLIFGLCIYYYSKRLLFEYIRCLPNDSDDVIAIETDGIYFSLPHLDKFVENVRNYKNDENDINFYPIAFGDELGNLKIEKVIQGMNKIQLPEDLYIEKIREEKSTIFIAKKMYYLYHTNEEKRDFCMTMKGVPRTYTDNNGQKVIGYGRETYEALARGEKRTIEYTYFKKNLFNDTYIAIYNTSRTIQPMKGWETLYKTY